MNNRSNGNRIGMLLLGLCLAIGLIVSAVIVTQALERIKLANEKITVKGFAEEIITSDVAVWRGKVVSRSENLQKAYERLERDTQTLLTYLYKEGVPSEQIESSPVLTSTQYKLNDRGQRTSEIDGYVLEQQIELNSSDVPLVTRLSKESSQLIKQNMEFMSFAPQYFYSAFNDIKVRLIGKATQNAKLRAEQFAQNSGIQISHLKSARQGVFQVTPIHSTDISGYGRYDTNTVKKSIKAVVTIDYAISKN
jgi:hypothetical protein